MNVKNTIGLIVSGAVFVGSFWLMGGLGAYWNLAALLVVGSGLAASILLSYPFADIRNALRVAKGSYSNRQTGAVDIVRTLLELAVRCRVDGVLSLEKASKDTTSTFLRNGLMMLVDNCKEGEIRRVLTNEMSFFGLRRQQSERIFQNMARTAPAFGVAGSVIGLIGLLMGINDTTLILQSIPVALISTLYGVVLGSLVLAPVAENIHFNTRSQLLNHKLVLEGILAIRREQNPYHLERLLSSYLTPEDRQGQHEALRAITRRHIERKKERKRAPEVTDNPLMPAPTPSSGNGNGSKPAQSAA